MAKIERKHQKIFALNATNNGQFGSAQLGTKVTSSDLDTLQQLSAWEDGWLLATLTAQRLPTLEEMQGIQYVTTSQLAYVFQEGIPEWNVTATYYENSIVKFAGSSEIYVSKTDDNIGNLPSDVANWDFGVDILKTVYSDETTVTDGSVAVFETDDSNGRKIREETIASFAAIIGEVLYPVGSLYINKTDNTNPGTLLGFGTWVQKTDHYIAARGGTIGGSGGSYTDSLTISETNLPSTFSGNIVGNTLTWDQGSNSPNGSNPRYIGTTNSSTPGSTNITLSSYSFTGIGSSTPLNVDVVPTYEGYYIWERTA